MALPDLTPQQRAQALEKATRARRRRAEVKDALKSRKITLSEVIDMAATDDAIAKMKGVLYWKPCLESVLVLRKH